MLLSAAVCKTDCKKVLASIARLLETRPQSLHKAKSRMNDATKEERPYFFIDDETSCNAYDPTWAVFVTECWDNLTRASECTSDEVKDPQTDVNGNHMTHRIHWINHRLDDMLPIMLAMGKAEFGNRFTVSRPTMLKCKKYYHRYPGRNTCLCRYCIHTATTAAPTASLTASLQHLLYLYRPLQRSLQQRPLQHPPRHLL